MTICFRCQIAFPFIFNNNLNSLLISGIFMPNIKLFNSLKKTYGLFLTFFRSSVFIATYGSNQADCSNLTILRTVFIFKLSFKSVISDMSHKNGFIIYVPVMLFTFYYFNFVRKKTTNH